GRVEGGVVGAGLAPPLVEGRLIQSRGREGPTISGHAAKSRLKVISTPAERGPITTADGTILALTVQRVTVTADPPQISGKTPAATAAVRQQVAGLLAGPPHPSAGPIPNSPHHPPPPGYVVLAPGGAPPPGNHDDTL